MSNIINKKIDHLLSYTWGLGLEHEMHIFHKPKKNVKDFFRKSGFVDCVTCTIVKNVTNNSLRVTNVTQKWLKRCNF